MIIPKLLTTSYYNKLISFESINTNYDFYVTITSNCKIIKDLPIPYKIYKHCQ